MRESKNSTYHLIQKCHQILKGHEGEKKNDQFCAT